MWDIHPYKAIPDNKKILVKTWKNLDIMLRQRNQSQNVYYIIPFIYNVQNKQICSDRKQISSCLRLRDGGRGKGENEKWLLTDKCLFCDDDENVPNLERS